jgi:hypothetical protein
MQKLLNLRHALFAALLLWCVQMSAQNPNFTYTNELLDVTYVNTAFTTGIAKDDGTGYFTAPDWSSRGRNPVAYVSGTKLKVTAHFKFSCTPTGTVYVKGVNADGYDLPPVALTFSGTEGSYEGECKTAFPVNVVNAFDKFAISWQMSTDVNLPYKEMATSANPLYVLYAEPFFVGQNFPNASGTTFPLLTTIHLACTNAKGKNNVQEIADAIYSEFQDQKVRKVDGTRDMGYWGGVNPLATLACRSVTGLLVFEDATCGTWATFFNDMLLLNGILGSSIGIVTVLGTTELSGRSGNNLYDDIDRTFGFLAANTYQVYPYFLDNSSVPRAMFYVKNWQVSNSRSFSFCSQQTLGTLGFYQCGNDLVGLPSQGNANPRAYFENHAVIIFKPDINSSSYKVYDPSYGSVPQSSKQDWINSSIDATGAIFRLPTVIPTIHGWFEYKGGVGVQID